MSPYLRQVWLQWQAIKAFRRKHRDQIPRGSTIEVDHRRKRVLVNGRPFESRAVITRHATPRPA